MKLLWAISVLSSFAIFAAQAPALADDEFADIAAKAKAEGEVTWYTAHFDTTLVGKIGSAFTAKYPGIKVNGLKATAQISYQRLLQDLSAGAPQADVFSSTDASQFVELARKNMLEAYRPQNEKKIIATFQNFDPTGFSHVTAVSLVAITYNNQKVSEADIPKTWQGLLDPKWSNKIALGDPNFSGMVGAWSVTLQKMYGWDYFSRLSDSKPLITPALRLLPDRRRHRGGRAHRHPGGRQASQCSPVVHGVPARYRSRADRSGRLRAIAPSGGPGSETAGPDQDQPRRHRRYPEQSEGRTREVARYFRQMIDRQG